MPGGDLAAKKRCTPFIVVPILLLLVLHVYADRSSVTTTPAVPAAVTTSLTLSPVPSPLAHAATLPAHVTSGTATTGTFATREIPVNISAAHATGNLNSASSPPDADTFPG